VELLNIAHRGASGRFPENTLRAFAAAFESGADMCELDVRLARDGTPVVLHDATVDRTTDGYGAVDAMSLQELKRLDAGVKFGIEFAGERVPALAEVLKLAALAKGRRGRGEQTSLPGVHRHGRGAFNLELKAAGTEDAVCDLIRSHEAVNSTLVSSFDWPALSRVRRRAPEIRIGLLASARPAQLLTAAMEMGANAIIPRFDMVDQDLCRAAHMHAIDVYAWTVDAIDIMRELAAKGVDGIMTNYPERLAQMRRVKREE
jgi:glycerophosphoryl diester phosphodiesterase